MSSKTLAALCACLCITPAGARDSIPTLDEIVVTATRVPQARGEVLADVRVLGQEAIATAGQASITDLLQSQPGIEIVANGGLGQPTNVLLGGYSGSQTLVLVDGFRVGSATLGMTPLDQFLPTGFERIEVLRGAGSHLYGADAMGGVLQFFAPRGEGKPRMHASAGLGDWSTRRFDAGLRGGVDHVSFALDAGRLRSDGMDATNAKAPFGIHNPDADGFRHDHLLLSGGLALSPEHRLDLVGFRTQGRSEYDDGPGPHNTHSEVTQELLGLTLRSRLSDHWDSQLRAGLSQDDSSFFTSFGNSKYKTDQHQYAWQNDWRLGDNRVQAILDRLEQSVSGSVAYTTRERDNTGLVLSGQTQQGMHAFEVTWRHDHNSQFGDQDTGALGYAWLGLPGWRLSARLATAFRAPSFNDLYYPDDGFLVGNPNLDPEESFSREITLQGSLAGGSLRLSCHDDRVTDLILWQFDLGHGKFTPDNVNKARLTGCGIQYSGRVAGWLGRIGFDWQRAEDEATHQDLPWRSPRRLTLAAHRSFDAWELGAELTASDKRYNDAANTQRLSGYTLVTLNAAYRLAPEWRIEGRLANALNQDYELVHGYNTPERNLFVTLRYQPR
ncbi:MAG: TonB-dependent receptor [Gammaproteobacteria bacterium]|nr:TonB-dependent receptor [Gammaproteobacteria bacterium]